MLTVTTPSDINAAFASAFNSRSVDALLALYEPDAVLRTGGPDPRDYRGLDEIGDGLRTLVALPGTMVSQNVWCLAQGDLALLRAHWTITFEGREIAAGRSAEVVRRQPDGRWLYVIDHADGSAAS